MIRSTIQNENETEYALIPVYSEDPHVTRLCAMSGNRQVWQHTSRRRVNAGWEGSTSTAFLSYPVLRFFCTSCSNFQLSPAALYHRQSKVSELDWRARQHRCTKHHTLVKTTYPDPQVGLHSVLVALSHAKSS